MQPECTHRPENCVDAFRSFGVEGIYFDALVALERQPPNPPSPSSNARAVSTPSAGLWCARRAVAFAAISMSYRDPLQYEVHFGPKSAFEESGSVFKLFLSPRWWQHLRARMMSEDAGGRFHSLRPRSVIRDRRHDRDAGGSNEQLSKNPSDVICRMKYPMKVR
jgi:hypothetical protein